METKKVKLNKGIIKLLDDVLNGKILCRTKFKTRQKLLDTILLFYDANSKIKEQVLNAINKKNLISPLCHTYFIYNARHVNYKDYIDHALLNASQTTTLAIASKCRLSNAIKNLNEQGYEISHNKFLSIVLSQTKAFRYALSFEYFDENKIQTVDAMKKRMQQNVDYQIPAVNEDDEDYERVEAMRKALYEKKKRRYFSGRALRKETGYNFCPLDVFGVNDDDTVEKVELKIIKTKRKLLAQQPQTQPQETITLYESASGKVNHGLQGIKWLAACGANVDRLRIKDARFINYNETLITHYAAYKALNKVTSGVWQVDINKAYVDALRKPLPIGTIRQVDASYKATDKETILYKYKNQKYDFLGVETCKNKIVTRYAIRLETLENADKFYDSFTKNQVLQPQAKAFIKTLGVAIIGQLAREKSLIATFIWNKIGLELAAKRKALEANDCSILKINTDSIAFTFGAKSNKSKVLELFKDNYKIEQENANFFLISSQCYQYEGDLPKGVRKDTLDDDYIEYTNGKRFAKTYFPCLIPGANYVLKHNRSRNLPNNKGDKKNKWLKNKKMERLTRST